VTASTELRIGSLFTGTGALDMAVQQVFGGTVAWHCQYDPTDPHQYAARILAHHWPHVPNLGNVTAVDWAHVEPVDILTAGFPCQDVSLAGKRAGIAEGTRSGLWSQVVRCIESLRPSLVILENVRGILSAPADGDLEPCPWCLGDTGGESHLRACGAVLADLAGLGLDAEWQGLPASAVGAPHERWRWFCIAWPAAADADVVGAHRAWACGGRRDEPADHGQPAADPARVGHGHAWAPRIGGLPAATVAGGPAAAADARRFGRLQAERHLQPGQSDAEGRPAADTAGERRGEGGAEPARVGGGSDVAVGGAPDWGQFEPAILRWQHYLGRPAPRPVDDRGRLAPEFPEWMMGYPAGHITAVPPAPGMTASQLRNARLKAAGNGVVMQQAEAALRLLLARVTAALAA
jgi:DNA (cytosine-5)-methyltransferase 1